MRRVRGGETYRQHCRTDTCEGNRLGWRAGKKNFDCSAILRKVL